MFKRTLHEKLSSYAHQFSNLFLTGPRQNGKTSLLKRTFPDHTYLSLENPNTLSTVQYDPLGFFRDLSKKWIIDKAQEYPALFSFLQGLIDENPIPGHFILSGSQNFLLNDKITQSLAGRVGILELLPLTYTEYLTGKPPPKTIWDYFLKAPISWTSFQR